MAKDDPALEDNMSDDDFLKSLEESDPSSSDMNFGDLTDSKENREPETSTEKFTRDIGRLGANAAPAAANTLRNQITKAMPGVGDLADQGTELAQGLMGIKSDFESDVLPQLEKTKQKTKKLINTVAWLPDSVKNVANNLLGPDPERDITPSKDQQRNEATTQALDAIFNQQQANQEQAQEQHNEERKEDIAREAIRDSVTNAQHAQLSRLIATVANQGTYQTTFIKGTYTAYLRKDLELKYRMMYLQEDILEAIKIGSQATEKHLDAIRHNTALPDYDKITAKELIKRKLNEKMMSGFGGIVQNYIGDTVTKISKKVIGTAKDALGTSQMLLEGLTQAAEMDAQNGGTTRSTILGLAGTGLGNIVGKLGGKAVLKRLSPGTMEKLNSKASSFLGRTINKLARLKEEGGLAGSLADVFLPATGGRGTKFAINDDAAQDLNGSATFDKKFFSTVNEVIPTYLSNMLAVQKRQLYYLVPKTERNQETLSREIENAREIWDFQSGKMMNVQKFRADARTKMYGTKQEQASMLKSIGTEISENVDKSAFNLDDGVKARAKKYELGIAKFIFNLGKSTALEHFGVLECFLLKKISTKGSKYKPDDVKGICSIRERELGKDWERMCDPKNAKFRDVKHRSTDEDGDDIGGDDFGSESKKIIPGGGKFKNVKDFLETAFAGFESVEQVCGTAGIIADMCMEYRTIGTNYGIPYPTAMCAKIEARIMRVSGEYNQRIIHNVNFLKINGLLHESNLGTQKNGKYELNEDDIKNWGKDVTTQDYETSEAKQRELTAGERLVGAATNAANNARSRATGVLSQGIHAAARAIGGDEAVNVLDNSYNRIRNIASNINQGFDNAVNNTVENAFEFFPARIRGLLYDFIKSSIKDDKIAKELDKLIFTHDKETGDIKFRSEKELKQDEDKIIKLLSSSKVIWESVNKFFTKYHPIHTTIGRFISKNAPTFLLRMFYEVTPEEMEEVWKQSNDDPKTVSEVLKALFSDKYKNFRNADKIGAIIQAVKGTAHTVSNAAHNTLNTIGEVGNIVGDTVRGVSTAAGRTHNFKWIDNYWKKYDQKKDYLKNELKNLSTEFKRDFGELSKEITTAFTEDKDYEPLRKFLFDDNGKLRERLDRTAAADFVLNKDVRRALKKIQKANKDSSIGIRILKKLIPDYFFDLANKTDEELIAIRDATNGREEEVRQAQAGQNNIINTQPQQQPRVNNRRNKRGNKRHAVGGLVDEATEIANGHIAGEHGAEVVVPLEHSANANKSLQEIFAYFNNGINAVRELEQRDPSEFNNISGQLSELFKQNNIANNLPTQYKFSNRLTSLQKSFDDPNLSDTKKPQQKLVEIASGQLEISFAIYDRLNKGLFVNEYGDAQDAPGFLKRFKANHPELINSTKTALGTTVSWGKRLLKGTGHVLASPFVLAGRGIKGAVRQSVSFGTNALFNRYFDVYRKPAENEPLGSVLLTAKQIQDGVFKDIECTKPLESAMDIDGPVYDASGNLLITPEDFQNGLVDASGKEFLSAGARLGRMSRAFGIASFKFAQKHKVIGKTLELLRQPLTVTHAFFVPYMDVYVKGETEPRVTAQQFRDGLLVYHDNEGNEKPIRDVHTIKHPVYWSNSQLNGEKAGQIAITYEDIQKGLVDSRGKPLNRITRLFASGVRGGFGILGRGIRALGGNLSSLVLEKGWQATKAVAKYITTKTNPFIDVYVRTPQGAREKEPRIQGIKIKNGEYFFIDATPLKSAYDIDRPVPNPEDPKQMLITEEEIREKRLVDFENNEITKFKGKSLLGKALSITAVVAKKTISTAWKVGKKLAKVAGSAVKGAWNGLVGGGETALGKLKDQMKKLYGSVKNGLGYKGLGKLDLEQIIGTRLDIMTAIMQGKDPTAQESRLEEIKKQVEMQGEVLGEQIGETVGESVSENITPAIEEVKDRIEETAEEQKQQTEQEPPKTIQERITEAGDKDKDGARDGSYQDQQAKSKEKAAAEEKEKEKQEEKDWRERLLASMREKDSKRSGIFGFVSKLFTKYVSILTWEMKIALKMLSVGKYLIGGLAAAGMGLAKLGKKFLFGSSDSNNDSNGIDLDVDNDKNRNGNNNSPNSNNSSNSNVPNARKKKGGKWGKILTGTAAVLGIDDALDLGDAASSLFSSDKSSIKNPLYNKDDGDVSSSEIASMSQSIDESRQQVGLSPAKDDNSELSTLDQIKANNGSDAEPIFSSLLTSTGTLATGAGLVGINALQKKGQTTSTSPASNNLTDTITDEVTDRITDRVQDRVTDSLENRAERQIANRAAGRAAGNTAARATESTTARIAANVGSKSGELAKIFGAKFCLLLGVGMGTYDALKNLNNYSDKEKVALQNFIEIFGDGTPQNRGNFKTVINDYRSMWRERRYKWYGITPEEAKNYIFQMEQRCIELMDNGNGSKFFTNEEIIHYACLFGLVDSRRFGDHTYLEEFQSRLGYFAAWARIRLYGIFNIFVQVVRVYTHLEEIPDIKVAKTGYPDPAFIGRPDGVQLMSGEEAEKRFLTGREAADNTGEEQKLNTAQSLGLDMMMSGGPMGLIGPRLNTKNRVNDDATAAHAQAAIQENAISNWLTYQLADISSLFSDEASNKLTKKGKQDSIVPADIREKIRKAALAEFDKQVKNYIGSAFEFDRYTAPTNKGYEDFVKGVGKDTGNSKALEEARKTSNETTENMNKDQSKAMKEIQEAKKKKAEEDQQRLQNIIAERNAKDEERIRALRELDRNYKANREVITETSDTSGKWLERKPAQEAEKEKEKNKQENQESTPQIKIPSANILDGANYSQQNKDSINNMMSNKISDIKVSNVDAANIPDGGKGDLGSYVKRFESGNRGSSAVGWDSTGGTSYGTYQLAAKTGAMKEFLRYAKNQGGQFGNELVSAMNQAGPLDTGSKKGAGPEIWKKFAAADGGKALHKLETGYIYGKYYKVALDKIKDSSAKSLLMSDRGLQEALWSTAIQHGPGGAGKIFNATYKSGMSPADWLKAIYAKRGTQFGSSKPSVRKSVLNRYKQELPIVLGLSANSTIKEQNGNDSNGGGIEGNNQTPSDGSALDPNTGANAASDMMSSGSNSSQNPDGGYSPTSSVPAMGVNNTVGSARAQRVADFATSHAESHSVGKCAGYVRKALDAGGYKPQPQPSAYMYASKNILAKVGFSKIDKKSPPQKGDIVVWSNVPEHKHGHIQVFNGKQWVSDFKQKNFSPYRKQTPSQTWTLWRDLGNQQSPQTSQGNVQPGREAGGGAANADDYSKQLNSTINNPESAKSIINDLVQSSLSKEEKLKVLEGFTKRLTLKINNLSRDTEHAFDNEEKIDELISLKQSVSSVIDQVKKQSDVPQAKDTTTPTNTQSNTSAESAFDKFSNKVNISNVPESQKATVIQEAFVQNKNQASPKTADTIPQPITTPESNYSQPSLINDIKASSTSNTTSTANSSYTPEPAMTINESSSTSYREPSITSTSNSNNIGNSSDNSEIVQLLSQILQAILALNNNSANTQNNNNNNPINALNSTLSGFVQSLSSLAGNGKQIMNNIPQQLPPTPTNITVQSPINIKKLFPNSLSF